MTVRALLGGGIESDDGIIGSMPILISPVAEMKQRQLNAIEIAKTICRHPTASAHLYELLTTRLHYLTLADIRFSLGIPAYLACLFYAVRYFIQEAYMETTRKACTVFMFT